MGLWRWSQLFSLPLSLMMAMENDVVTEEA